MQYTTAREEIRTIRVCFIKQIVLLPYKSDNKTAVQSERLFHYFNILEYPLPSCTQRDTRLKVAEEMEDFFGITGYERTVGILSRIFTVLETGKMGERLDIYGPAPL